MSLKKKKLQLFITYNDPTKTDSVDDLDYISESAVQDEANFVFETAKNLGYAPVFFPVKNLESDLDKILNVKPDLIFNLCEGYQGNARFEMHIACLWELFGIPYTGNTPATIGISQNKILAKHLFVSKRIHTPEFQVYCKPPENTFLDFPVIAKPSREDASLGINQNSVIHNLDALYNKVVELLEKYRQPILVEKFIQGREFNIAVFGNHPPRVLPVSEIMFFNINENDYAITSYEAKWLPDSPLYKKTPSVCPAKIDTQLKERLADAALQVYKLLGGRDYGRVDTRVDAMGRIYILEYNPNPDISPDAGFTKALKAGGISFSEFIEKIIQEALTRNNYDL